MALSLEEKVELANACLEVLKNGKKGKGTLPRMQAAYQVLDRLKGKQRHTDRDSLIDDYGEPGRGSGNHFPASQIVSRALMLLAQYNLVKYHYATATGIGFSVAGNIVTPGYQTFAFYQLTSQGMEADHLEIVEMGPGKKKMIRIVDNTGEGFVDISTPPEDQTEVEE